MFRLFNCFLFIALLSVAKYSYAQDPVYYVKTLTVENGLPQSYVSDIVQDANGFLWVSTLNGLGRYDGKGFKLYQHTMANKNSMSGNIILRMFLAQQNWLWLCYDDGKIDLFNTVTEQMIRLGNKQEFKILRKESNNFKSLMADADHHFWMLANDGGVFQIDPLKQTIQHFTYRSLKLDEPAVAIISYQQKLVWLTKKDLVFAKTNQHIPYPFGSLNKNNKGVKEQYKPVVRKNGDILIIDSNGLKIWNPNTNYLKQIKLHSFDNPDQSLVILTSSHNNFYFGLGNVIYRLDADNVLKKWIVPDQQRQGKFLSMCIDQSGVFWLGTNGFGLQQYNQAKRSLPGYLKENSFIKDVLIKAGYDSTEIEKTVIKYSYTFSSRNVTRGDSLWISEAYQKFDGINLVLVTRNNLKNILFKNADPKDNLKRSVRFLAMSDLGILWGISQNNNLIKFNLQQHTYSVQGTVKINQVEFIKGMELIDEQRILISTPSQFLLYNLQQQKTTDLTSKLPASNILCTKKDPVNPDILWIGTLADGMLSYHIKSGAVKSFNNLNGLPNNTVYGIIPHGKNELWCSSNKGIFCFQKDSKTIRSFTSVDGLPNDEFNSFEYMALPNGQVAFGGPIGYTLFNPAQVVDDQFNPKVVITDIEIINTQLTPAYQTVKSLDLRYDQNFIKLAFAAMQFDIPQKLKYRYKLKGLNDEWVDVGEQNNASYTSLPPGDYVFMVNASNTSGKWSSNITQVKINIASPFWDTWWFYILCFLAVMLLIYLFLKSRIRKIKQAEKQKLDFERESLQLHAMALRARMNPHFIFNCLNSIKALIQQKDEIKAISYLTTFSTLIRNQLNNNGNEISLAEELATCKLYMELEAMRFENHIAYEVNIKEKHLLETTMVPPLTLQPFIENAIVHGLLPAATGGKIKLSIYRDGQYVVCEIEDDGIGRAAAMINKEKSRPLHKSQGIGLLEQRINLHNHLNGSMSAYEIIDLYDKEKAKGTLVKIKFNIDEL